MVLCFVSMKSPNSRKTTLGSIQSIQRYSVWGLFLLKVKRVSPVDNRGIHFNRFLSNKTQVLAGSHKMVLVADPWAALIKWHSLWSICPGCAVNGRGRLMLSLWKQHCPNQWYVQQKTGISPWMSGVDVMSTIVIKAGDQKSVAEE